MRGLRIPCHNDVFQHGHLLALLGHVLALLIHLLLNAEQQFSVGQLLFRAGFCQLLGLLDLLGFFDLLGGRRMLWRGQGMWLAVRCRGEQFRCGRNGCEAC